MRYFDTRTDSRATLEGVFSARLGGGNETAHAAEQVVQAIIADVKARGDEAVLEYTRRWSHKEANRVRVTHEELEQAARRVEQTPLWEVLLLAHERITRFHEAQRKQSWVDTSRPGETLGQIVRPLKRVGVYAPGGTASYPSTVLMTALPAKVAGVPHIAVATPPSANSANGLPPDTTLAACYLAGVSEVYAMGGAQAIAALAFGTETVGRVDKIAGPGNLYVNLAKRFLYGTVGIDALAGPSEVAVLADDEADPDGAAADVLAQCEHDAHTSALVATHSPQFAARFVQAIEEQVTRLPRREFAEKALQTSGFVVQTQSVEESAGIVSLYAPEHLHLLVRDPWSVLPLIENAGAILMGAYTTAPLGDYLAGPSHSLPTAGCARFASPLGVDDFVKRTSLLQFDRKSSEQLSPLVARFAEAEGLEAHTRAARHPFGQAHE